MRFLCVCVCVLLLLWRCIAVCCIRAFVVAFILRRRRRRRRHHHRRRRPSCSRFRKRRTRALTHKWAGTDDGLVNWIRTARALAAAAVNCAGDGRAGDGGDGGGRTKYMYAGESALAQFDAAQPQTHSRTPKKSISISMLARTAHLPAAHISFAFAQHHHCCSLSLERCPMDACESPNDRRRMRRRWLIQ